MYFAIRFFEHLDFLEEDQFQRSFPVDHIQWFKRGIEQKDLTESVHSFAEAARDTLVNLDQKPGPINVFARVGPKPAPNISVPAAVRHEGAKKTIALRTHYVNIKQRKRFRGLTGATESHRVSHVERPCSK